MDPDFSWIYLIFFLIIPLARIIPRMLNRKKTEEKQFQTVQEEQFHSTFEEKSKKTQREFSKPQTKNMLVLGEVNKGIKTFENILKNTGLNGKELDTILEDLEKNNMIKVRQKQGLFGIKVELLPTDKGFKEYYS